MNSINQTELNLLITNILQGKIPDVLKNIGMLKHPSNDSNYQFHITCINKLIEKTRIENTNCNYLLSRISILKYNKIKIDLYINKCDGNINFYIVGDDLQYYHMYLPSIIDRNRLIKPRTGTHNSKWYPWIAKKLMINISINLRLLEILLKYSNVSIEYMKQTYGILGLEVNFDIPEHLKSNTLICSFDELNSKLNPIKLKSGFFLFGKNGTNNQIINSMLKYIKTNFYDISEQLFDVFLDTYDLNEFINSNKQYAIVSWKYHCRIIFKSNIDNNIILNIIDPWMKYLESDILENLISCNSKCKINFIIRKIKDQDREGSCALCSIARLLYLLDNQDINFDILINNTIPDFYIYWTSLIYRKCDKF